MARFVPRNKLSKKAKRALDAQKRRSWGSISPITRRAESKKVYNRKKSPDRWNDYGRGFCFT